MDIEEFAPHMRPTASLDNPTADEQLVEPGIAISLDDAAEALQMDPRMLAFAVGRVAEQGGRRPRAGEWPLVAYISPQPAGLGLAGPRRQNRHRCIVNMKSVAGQHVGRKGVNQRLQRRRRRPDPGRQGRGSRLTPSRAKISAWR